MHFKGRSGYGQNVNAASRLSGCSLRKVSLLLPRVIGGASKALLGKKTSDVGEISQRTTDKVSCLEVKRTLACLIKCKVLSKGRQKQHNWQNGTKSRVFKKFQESICRCCYNMYRILICAEMMSDVSINM